jgi:hypothetical protein
LEEEVEEAFNGTPEEKTSEEERAEGASKTVFGKTTKEVVVEWYLRTHKVKAFIKQLIIIGLTQLN